MANVTPHPSSSLGNEGIEGEPVLSDDSWLLREEVLRRFEDAWRKGSNPRIEDFLLGDLASDHGLLVELIHLDIEYRIKSGQPATFSEYGQRFPELAHYEPVTVDLTAANRDTTESTTVPVVPGYKELSEIGRGGMGIVYVARQSAVGRLVALKMIRSAHDPRPSQLARLRIEAEAIGRLQHPNIVQIYDVGETDGRPYLAMEFVPGTDLATRLKMGPLPPREAAELIETLARAIHHAHTRGIVHRDLTPGNILIASADVTDDADKSFELKSASSVESVDCRHLKITDFGLAKVLADDSVEQTQTGMILGTPSYMAPEQAEGNVRLIGPRTDIYGLGAVLYAALTGRPPFQSDSHWRVTRQIIEEQPSPLSKLVAHLPRDLETICMKCLRKAPHQRYGSAEDLADDLRRFLNREPIVARRVGLAERVWLWARRNPAVAATLTVATLAVLLTGAIGFGQVVAERARFREERDRAEANLYRSLVNEAQAQIRARETGWWWSSMDTLRRAAALPVADRDPVELRDLVAECMGTEYPCFRLHGTWSGHQGRVTAAAINADGRWAATAAADQTIRLWSVPEGRCLAVFTAHTGPITGVAFDPSGPRLASSSHDGTVLVWDLSALSDKAVIKSQPSRTVNLDAGRVNAIEFLSDGSRLAAGCEDGSVFLIPIAGEGSPSRLTQEESEVLSIAIAPDKPIVAIGIKDKPLRLRDLESGHENGTALMGNRVVSMAFDGAPGGIAAADPDIFGYRATYIPLGQPVSNYVALHTNGVVKVAWVGRIGHESCYHWLTASIDGSIRVWAGGSTRQMAIARGNFGPLRSAALGGNKPWVVAGYFDGQVRLWELAIPPHRNVHLGGGAPAARFLGSTRQLVRPPYVQDFSAPMASAKMMVPDPARTYGLIWALASSPDGRRFATGHAGGAVYLWNAATLKIEMNLSSHQELAWCAAFSPDAKYLATGGNDVRVRDAADGKEIHVFDVGDNLVRAVAFHPRQPWLVAAVKDRTLRAWDLTTGQPLGEPVQLDAEIYGLAFRPDGRRLAAACFDQKVSVWDLPDEPAKSWPATQPTWRFEGHRAEVWGVAYSPDGRWLATGSEHGIVLMDAESHIRLVTLRGVEGQIRSLSFSADGELLAAASYSKPAIVWRLPLVRRTLAEMGLDW